MKVLAVEERGVVLLFSAGRDSCKHRWKAVFLATKKVRMSCLPNLPLTLKKTAMKRMSKIERPRANRAG